MPSSLSNCSGCSRTFWAWSAGYRSHLEGGAIKGSGASNAEQERKRRQAERTDPRPAVNAPAIDAPWLPQMQLLDDVLGTLNIAEPPMRNNDGMLTQCRMRTPVAMHAFGSNAANGEDAEGEETRLPPPQQHLLTVLSEPESAELIERHIDFIDGTGRSVHLASPFVRHYMQRNGGALPIVGAIATLPLVLADGAVLAEPGLNRERGIVFRLEPGIVALMPRPKIAGMMMSPAAMHFLCEEWLIDVATSLRRQVHSDCGGDDNYRALAVSGPPGLLGDCRPTRWRKDDSPNHADHGDARLAPGCRSLDAE